MPAEIELAGIQGEIAKIFGRITANELPTEFFAPSFKRLALEASAILDAHFGLVNSFSRHLWPATQLDERGYLGRSIITVMAEAQQVIFGAINQIRREPLLGPKVTASTKPPYVDGAIISSLGTAKSHSYDLARLIQMCRELNVAHQEECHVSVIILVRAIIDHVPPIFGERTFTAVANNLPHSKKKSLLNLENSSRNIADSYLHQHIRKREVLPTATEVNFSPDMSVLLGEVVRALAEQQG